MTSKSTLAISLAIVMALCSRHTLAQIYTATDIGFLPSTGKNPITRGYGVNDSGQVTGYSYVAPNVFHAFLYSNGVLQDLGTLPGYTLSTGAAINNSGQVTGNSIEAGISHAFLYSNGVMQDLGTLGGVSSEGTGINAVGEVTGESIGISGQHAFLFSNGAMHDLGTLGGESSQGSAINSSGQVVGSSQTVDGDTHAFLYSDGVMQDLGTLGGATSRGLGINDSGEVVGSSYLPDESTIDLFLYSKGVMYDLGTINTDGTDAQINASGQINVVGETILTSGETGSYAALYTNGEWFSVNELMKPPWKMRVPMALGISDNGNIVVWGPNTHTYLLAPGAPSVAPIIRGRLGQNGWYVSNPTTLKWTVSQLPVAPTEIGCGNVTIPDTKGTKYTCSATNQYGTNGDFVTVQKDTVAPKVLIKRPANNSTYALNAVILASYTCTDTTSGVASCAGTVTDGAAISTSISGVHSFSVIATDNAGNSITKSVMYNVNP